MRRRSERKYASMTALRAKAKEIEDQIYKTNKPIAHKYEIVLVAGGVQ